MDDAKRLAAIQRLDSVLVFLHQAKTLGVTIDKDIVDRIEEKLVELGG